MANTNHKEHGKCYSQGESFSQRYTDRTINLFSCSSSPLYFRLQLKRSHTEFKKNSLSSLFCHIQKFSHPGTRACLIPYLVVIAYVQTERGGGR